MINCSTANSVINKIITNCTLEYLEILGEHSSFVKTEIKSNNLKLPSKNVHRRGGELHFILLGMYVWVLRCIIIVRIILTRAEFVVLHNAKLWNYWPTNNEQSTNIVTYVKRPYYVYYVFVHSKHYWTVKWIPRTPKARTLFSYMQWLITAMANEAMAWANGESE